MPSTLTAATVAAAIERDEMVLAYQPQWTANGADIVSFEALVRWRHPELGVLSPDQFLPLAEASGLMPSLTQRLIARLCREAQTWDDLPVAVNISPAEFADPGLVDMIRRTADGLSFPLHRIEVEVVETSLFGDLAVAERTLDALRALGIRIALDDFGTGYSSLSLLRRLPFDKVKIDKSFIDDITSIKSASIVHAVIALARAIGLKITAEGVETPEQQLFLKTAGCHFIQGFLFARPLWPEQVHALLASRVLARSA